MNNKYDRIKSRLKLRQGTPFTDQGREQAQRNSD